VWGENHPVGWAWDITNFVFWIGIGHAGTLISAILFLTRQKWRTSINRASEAMTLFAVICAAIFPGIHVGRVWMVWFLAPIPNQNANWPNFRSPLLWDVFAVSTYFTVSVLFWYTGLVPDLATLRDRAKTRVKKFFFTLFALGWRGGNRQWRHYEMAYLILAGISTPLVLSVHSVVSFDFATSIVPGWHTTIFPPYFVAGAIFGGFAMVLTILLPARLLYPQLKDVVTPQHVDKMAKIILLTGSIVGYAYMMELFIAWYGANPNERAAFYNRAFGPYWWAYWSMITCNVVSPQFFWSKKLRHNLIVVFIICNFVNAGMWFERFVIIVTSIAQDYLPSAWHLYHPTWVEIWTFIGTFGIFLSLFLLFMRYLPMVAMSEVKVVLPEANPHHYVPDSQVGIDAHHHREKSAPEP
jgi:Ni/Fe-hydrogenase subunit HybB-like protein